MAEKEPTPDMGSGDYVAMLPYWELAQTMLDGADAMRAAGKKYLPKFPKESSDTYEHRRKHAKFTNIFRDIVENLAAKPFAKKLTVKDKTMSSELRSLTDDIDGRGNNLHVFAGTTFFNGIAKAVDYIFVDYTKVPLGATVAVEKRLGARPYWVQIAAERVVAAYTDMVDGKEQFVHVRILEPTKVRQGFGEAVLERVRVYDRPKIKSSDPDTGAVVETYGPAVWVLYEKRKKKDSTDFEWVPIDNGSLRVKIIPLVPFVTGRRKEGSWQFYPPMKDAADLQIEHFQQETNLKCAKEVSCFPMIKAIGVSPKVGKNGEAEEFPSGPGVVCYAPTNKQGINGDYGFLEPAATSLTFLAGEIDKTEEQLRELGRQPLTAQSGNLTTVTTAVAAAKGNSAVQAWAWNLKDALELALHYTALWLLDMADKPEVDIYTDFGIEVGDGTSMSRLIEMRKNGDLDQDTLWTEAMRRGELSGDFDMDKARQRLAEEAPQEPTPEELAAGIVPLRPKPPAKPPERIAA